MDPGYLFRNLTKMSDTSMLSSLFMENWPARAARHDCINPAFTDHNAACVVVEEDHSYFMIHVHGYFQSFTDLPIGDPAVNPTASVTIFLDGRDAVDTAVTDGFAAGGVEPHGTTDSTAA